MRTVDLESAETFLHVICTAISIHWERTRQVSVHPREIARYSADAVVARYRTAVEQYVCGYCHNRVGFTPESGEWSLSVYHPPCRGSRGCAPLREALAAAGTATAEPGS